MITGQLQVNRDLLGTTVGTSCVPKEDSMHITNLLLPKTCVRYSVFALVFVNSECISETEMWNGPPVILRLQAVHGLLSKSSEG